MQGKKLTPRSNAKVNFHMLSDEPLRWNPFLRKGTVWLLRELESYRFPKSKPAPVTEGRQGQGKGKPGMLLVVGDGLLDELEELVGGVGAVLDHLQLVGRDPAHAGEKLRRCRPSTWRPCSAPWSRRTGRAVLQD